ncbi:MAG: hypothetical protein C5B57_10345, partial [Blastocatellia bacterium]
MTHRPIVDLLLRVRRRWQLLQVCQAAVRAGLGASTVFTIWLIAAYWIEGSSLALVVMATASLLFALGVGAWGFSPLRRRPSDAQLARFIEERVPSLDDRLVSAVDLLTGPTARPSRVALARLKVRATTSATDRASSAPRATSLPALAEPMLEDAAARASAIDLDVVVPREAVRRHGYQAIAAGILLLIVLFFVRGPAREAVDAASVALFPFRMSLEVRPGDVRIEAGHPLSIEARLPGNHAAITAQVQIGDGEDWRAIDMATDHAGMFQLALESVTVPFRYRVVAGKLVSTTYTVVVARAPRVTRIDLDYTYPPALHIAAHTEQDAGDIFAPSGTDVRVRVHTDTAVESGQLVLADGRTLRMSAEAPTQLSTTLKIVANNSYRVRLTGSDRLSSSGDTEYFIRVLEDRPPEVHITRPAGDRAVTRLEEVDIEVQADDDNGIERLDLVYSARGGDERVIPMNVPRHTTSATARYTLALEDLDIQPGDFVSYYVRARDLARGKQANEARSDIFFLDVRPFEQEFSLAQSQSMAGSGYTGAIDELVNAQRQVVVATWKLDRRALGANGVRSERDIHSIGTTEADLKERVEQTASSFRESSMRDPRTRVPGGSPSGEPRAGENEMTAASRAMGHAVESLNGLDTARALPPEMEALNHLLKAQSEIKHRQLATNQGTGSAGDANRNFDISTLFDRELRRQQQTNYETNN